jgi:catechol 2,3-dioxygenase-like lactoylglutathione lyase family enzyme
MNRIHLALNTHRFDESVNFYETLFGSPPIKLEKGYAKFDLEDPMLNLTLSASPSVINTEAINHLGVQVDSTDAVRQADQRLRAKGLPTLVEDDVTCCYAVQDKTWVADPDGHSWEFFVVKERTSHRS